MTGKIRGLIVQHVLLSLRMKINLADSAGRLQCHVRLFTKINEKNEPQSCFCRRKKIKIKINAQKEAKNGARSLVSGVFPLLFLCIWKGYSSLFYILN